MGPMINKAIIVKRAYLSVCLPICSDGICNAKINILWKVACQKLEGSMPEVKSDFEIQNFD